MATPRPKTFVAACDFSFGPDTYTTGDPVPAHEQLIAWGLIARADTATPAENGASDGR